MAVTVLIRKLDDPNINLGFVVDIADGFKQYGPNDLSAHIQVYLPNITREEVRELMDKYDADGNLLKRQYKMKLSNVAQIAAAGSQYTYNGSFNQLQNTFFERN